MTYRTEFPDFRPEDMPAIPAGWSDQSWHNDACPFFLATPSLGVFVNFADPMEREFSDCPRFLVVPMEDGLHPMDSDTLLQTDDWSEVLAYVERHC